MWREPGNEARFTSRFPQVLSMASSLYQNCECASSANNTCSQLYMCCMVYCSDGVTASTVYVVARAESCKNSLHGSRDYTELEVCSLSTHS